MQFALLGMAVATLWQTGYAAQDSNGNYILRPTTFDKKSVYTPEHMTVLKPILPGTRGIQKREGSRIGLVNDTSLFWGGKSNDSDIMVNMTLATGETQLILSMDHFADDLVSVVCDEDLSLTFKNAEHYEEAKDDWEWVNFDAQRTFLMLVNWGNCSSEAGRQPWVVTQTEYDPANFKVKFIADQKQWNELENRFTLEWGAYDADPIAPDDTSLTGRGFWDFFNVTGNDWGHNKTKHNKTKPDIDPSFAIPFNLPLPPTLISQNVLGVLDLSLGCERCHIKGKLRIGGKITGSLIGDIGITESYIQVSPDGLVVEFNPTFTISGRLIQPHQESLDLFTYAPFGLTIPNIFNIGPRTVIRVGFELSGIQGGATIHTGATATYNNHAIAKLDFHGNDTKSQGWQPTLDFKKVNLTAQIQGIVKIYHEIGFEFGLNILGQYDVGFGMELRVPKFSTTLAAEWKEMGYVCPNQPETFGVRLNSSLDTSISVAGWTSDRDRPIINVPLYDKPFLRLVSKCEVFKNGPKVSIAMKDNGSDAETNATTSATNSTSAANSTSEATQTPLHSGLITKTSTTNSNSAANSTPEATQTPAHSGLFANTSSTALPTPFNPRRRRHLLKHGAASPQNEPYHTDAPTTSVTPVDLGPKPYPGDIPAAQPVPIKFPRELFPTSTPRSNEDSPVGQLPNGNAVGDRFQPGV